MSLSVDIRPIGIEEIEHKFRNWFTKADLYIDYKRTEFAMIYDSDNRKVVYAKAKYNKKLSDIRADGTEISTIQKVIGSHVVNRLSFIENSERFNTICDVKYLVELHAFVLLTAGYRIGMACVEEFYKNNGEQVSYIRQKADGTSQIEDLTEEDLEKAAQVYFAYDMEIASSFGYRYYNKLEKITRVADDTTIRSEYAAQDLSRFGIESAPMDKPAKLMKYLTDFIPIGYEFSGYTPFIFTVDEFVSKLKNETVLGLDMINVPNHIQSGKIKDSVKSTAWYTTKKRLYQVLGYKFDYFSFQFVYRLLCGLFLEDVYYLNAGSVYVKSSYETNELYQLIQSLIDVTTDKLPIKVITEIEYNALDEDSQSSYKQINGEIVNKIAATYFVRKFISDMKFGCVSHRQFLERSGERNNFNSLIENLIEMTLDTISTDVAERERQSNDLFNYVGD